jgi:hypothetical protein
VSESQPPSPPQAQELEEEVLDALPVLAAQPRIARVPPTAPAHPARRQAGAVLPAVQAAAVAAGGFVAGAAVVGLVHHRQQRAAALGKSRRGGRALARSRPAGGRGAGKAAELVQIVGSRSLLVDVHLLGGSNDR